MLDNSMFGPVKVDPKPDYKYHELCTAWPQAGDEDLDKMVDVAKKVGGIFNDPTILWNGQILDGRNRQIVCKTLGIPMEYREFTGSYEQARTYAIAKNMARRHLTGPQKAVQHTLIAEVDARNGYGKGPTVRGISEAAKVNLRTAKDAITIVREGSKDAVERILAGESSPKKEVELLIKGAKKIDIAGFHIPKSMKPVDHTDDMFQDAAGETVPKRLHDHWRRLADFDRIKDVIDYLVPDLKRVMDHESGKGISIEYIRYLKELSKDLDTRRPHYVCPHCHGKLRCQCDRCTKRWLQRGSDSPMCYACQGHGFIMKEEPYPDPEWYVEFPKDV